VCTSQPYGAMAVSKPNSLFEPRLQTVHSPGLRKHSGSQSHLPPSPSTGWMVPNSAETTMDRSTHQSKSHPAVCSCAAGREETIARKMPNTIRGSCLFFENGKYLNLKGFYTISQIFDTRTACVAATAASFAASRDRPVNFYKS
jgi:hypothetical protein